MATDVLRRSSAPAAPRAMPADGGGAPLRIARLAKSYGDVSALRDLDLDVEAGEFVALLGPSGSGKTTTLMLVAGFETATRGSVEIGGRAIDGLSPHQRPLGIVFQHYALFPHMTVGENIAFPLTMRGVGRTERASLVATALAMVQLDGLADRYPDQLSGGQQQRVAVARATVYRPPLLLMDEPLGALDKKIREHMQLEIRRIHRELGITVVYVTHDQGEALSMADRVAVFRDGALQQVGTPAEVHDQPVNAFVADFIGDTSFIAGRATTIDGTQVEVVLPCGSAVAATRGVQQHEIAPGDAVRVAVRPDRVAIAAADDDGGGVPGQVTDVVYEGSTLSLVVELRCGAAITVRIRSHERAAGVDRGSAVLVSWQAGDARVYAENDR